MEARIGGRMLGADVCERILRAAGGNPLFVEEMAAIVQASDDGEVEVPPTLQALLTERLDQLEPERSVLERGAVEGEVFHHVVVQALTPDEPRLTRQLIALVRKQRIRTDQPMFAGEDAFRFRHLLMRDAAYARKTSSHHWMSSNTATTGPSAATASRSLRNAHAISSVEVGKLCLGSKGCGNYKNLVR